MNGPDAATSIHRKVLSNIQWREFAALFTLAIALAAYGNIVRCLDEARCVFPIVNSFKLHQFVFSYGDLGFAKRALLGSILGFDPALTSNSTEVRSVGVAIYLAFSALLLATLFSLPRAVRLLLVASPAIFLQAGFDLGRLDQLNYALLLLILFGGRRWAILLAPALVLLHEGALLIHLPTLFVAHRLIHGPGAAAGVAMAASAAAFGAITVAGGLGARGDLVALYPGVTDAIAEMLTRSLWENFGFVREIALGMAGSDFARLGLTLIAAAFAIGLLRRMSPSARIFGLPAHLAAFTPLLMALIGIDWPRWIALAVVNAVILSAVAAAKAPREDPGEAPWPTATLMAIAAVFALLGPMGDARALPLVWALQELAR